MIRSKGYFLLFYLRNMIFYVTFSEMNDKGLPTVIIPYPGPVEDYSFQDIFIYLRPEANDVKVESAILKVIEKAPSYKKDLFMVYLANLPGEFIMQHHIVEEHYSLKLRFAVRGKKTFTPKMIDSFQKYFNEDFESAPVIGSFDALNKLHLRPEELFQIWVPASEVLRVNGQTIKKISDHYVINYDIPALLHKNSLDTDIAVMIFRTRLNYDSFGLMISEMKESLINSNLLKRSTHPSRIFHYSKGPFEQILDGIGYLYTSDNFHVPLEELSYSRYLKERGVFLKEILGVLKNPILLCDVGNKVEEVNFMNYTYHDSYTEAYQKFKNIKAQMIIK